MFKQVVDAARQMLFLLRDVEQNKADIAALKEEDVAGLKEDIATLKADVASLKEGLAETNHLVRLLALEIQRNNENERQEREKFMLKVENILLRERQLPPARSRKKRK